MLTSILKQIFEDLLDTGWITTVRLRRFDLE